MKKFGRLLLLVALFTLSVKTFSQQGTIQRCGSMEHLAWMKTQDPGLEERMKQQEKTFQQFIIDHPNQVRAPLTTVTIPVVVHMVYKSASQNLPDSRVLEQINVLNTDYSGANPHSMYGFDPSLKINTGIQFCLAQQKPDGTATSGIERRQTTTTAFSTNDGVKHYSSGGLDAWDPTKYLNIWVCNMSGGILGYAQFPTSGINGTYGVVIQYSAFGVTGAAAPYNLGGTTSHEVGHCLNLYHIWGDDNGACTGTDYCGDTPNQANYNYGIPVFPHITCNNGPLGDMFTDFMDYTDDAGYANFTPNQNERMQACLVPGGLVNSLTTSAACQPGVAGACNAPSGLLSSNVTTNSATLLWGTVSGSTSYNIQYRIVNSAAWLTASSSTNSIAISGLTNASTYEFQVQTVCSANSSSLFSGSATFTTAAPGCVDNYEPNNSLASSTNILVNNNYQALISSATDVDYFKFSNTNSQKKIKITLTNLPADYDIRLYKSNGVQVGISQNGGTANETIIYNTGSAGTYYIKVYGYAGANSETSCYTLMAAISASNFRTSGSDITEPDTPMDLAVYPNPATNLLNIEYNNPEDGRITIRLYDITGRSVFEKDYEISKGLNTFNMNLEAFSKGLYFFELNSGNQRLTKKIILEK